MNPEQERGDTDVRTQVTTDLGTTILLEAGAGSGKTKVLVDRYLACVLDPQRGTGDVRRVAAITFTEKAAGELRQRVREELEKLEDQARATGTAPDKVVAIRRALDDLDDAPISTIHSFAGRLLREFPVEAGIDPAFEQLDALGSEIEVARLWEEWLAELATDEAREMPVRRWLTRLLQAGVKLSDVHDLAAGPKGVFGERYDIELDVGPPGESDLAAGAFGLAGPLERLREFCVTACTDRSDKGLAAAMDLVEKGRQLLAEPPADLDGLAAGLLGLPVKTGVTGPGGKAGNWSAALGGKEELLARYAAVAEGVIALREAYATFVTGLAVAVACAFLRWAGDKQLELGFLDFADLLGRLRDLLKGDLTGGDLSARAALQQRFDYLLVDEFQDTDPLQSEIVFWLCEREPKAREWRDVELKPGKLFVVGDPKQSIYRFRRADIAMYDDVKAIVRERTRGGAVLELGCNFRSTQGIVDWVNGVFGECGKVFVFEERRQPGYKAVTASRRPADGPAVSVLLGRAYSSASGEADVARRDEAGAVAALLVRMHGEEAARWQVQDRERQAAPGEDPMRPPKWGDIALLFRATTGLETYEQALRDAGVPYRVEGGKSYFSRREVDDALLCLRAVHDPSDGPAVYGALHSSLFGFSDDDLFLFWTAGGRFDPHTASQPDGHAPVVSALAVLRDLHELRTDLQAHELIVQLLRRVHAFELLAASGSGAAQAIANLEKLVERARAYSAAGGGGLGDFLEWAAQAGDAAGEQESQVDDASDVVQLMTIHKAKGLERPIVVLIGGARPAGGGGGEPIVDRDARGLAIKLRPDLPGVGACDLEPKRYLDLKAREKLMAESELRRLLYVAATRARDRLVISCFGGLVTQKGEPRSGVMLGPIAGQLPEPAEITEECTLQHPYGEVLVLPPGEQPVRAEPDAAHDTRALLGERAAWQLARDELLDVAARPARATSPSGLEHVDEEVRSGGPGAPPGRAKALVLGSAVHRVMELCDLGDESSVAPAAEAAALELGRPDLAHDTALLAGDCWRSAPVRAAAAAEAADPRAVHRELPVGALVDDVVVSGAVDLLYRDGDEWVVVDYKTDHAAEADVLRKRYAPQGAAYALAVRNATGRRVREVVFVAARAGGLDVHIPVDEALLASVTAEIGAAAGEGRAVRPDELAADPE